MQVPAIAPKPGQLQLSHFLQTEGSFSRSEGRPSKLKWKGRLLVLLLAGLQLLLQQQMEWLLLLLLLAAQLVLIYQKLNTLPVEQTLVTDDAAPMCSQLLTLLLHQ